MKKLFILLVLVIAFNSIAKAEDTVLVNNILLDKIGGNTQDMSMGTTIGYAVGTAANFIAKTTDAGNSWFLITSNAPAITPQCVDFINSTTGFVAGNSGMILKTTNGGLNWNSVGGSYAGTINAIAMLSADTIFACGTNNGGGTVIRSIDGGANWTIINPGNTTARNCIAFMPGGVILVGATTDMRRSTDGGSTWTGITITGAGTMADMETTSPTDVWAVSTSERIYKSTNAGLNFTLVHDGPGPFPLLSVSFIDANTGIFTGGNTTGGVAFKTTNGGTSFDTIDIKKYTAQIGQSVKMLSATDIVTACDMGCFMKTTDGGANWTYREFGSRLYAINFFNDLNGVAVGWRGVILKTTNGGANWSFIKAVQGTEGELYDVKMFDANTFYACGDQGRFWITTDGGANFTARPVPVTNAGSGKTIYFFNQNEGYYGGEMGQVYYTSDAGVNWTSQYSFGTTGSNNIEDIFFVNDSVGYAMGDLGKFAKTTNRLTWDSAGIDLPTATVFWTSHWFTPNSGFVGSVNGRIYQTSDGGVSWTIASDTAGMSGVDVIDLDMLQPHKGFAAAELGHFMVMDSASGLFKTYELLTTPYGVDVNLWGVDFVSNTKAYISGYNGAIYSAEYTPITSIISNNTPAAYNLEQNYPNPFNPSTTINFSIPNKAQVKLNIYDITGRQITSLINSELNSGTYSVTFNASALSSGVYFYKLETGSFSKTMKMLLVK